MQKNPFRINVLEDNPYSCVVKIGAPLIIVYFLNIVITLILQKLYTEYAGNNYFFIVGLLVGITGSIPNIYTSMASAAWIKTANSAVLGDADEKKKAFIDGFYALLFVSAIVWFGLTLFADAILGWLNVPLEIYGSVKKYYMVITSLYVFTGLVTYCIAIVNGVSNIWTLLFVNIFNVCIPLMMAIVLLIVFDLGYIGAAMVTGMASFVVVIVSLIVLRGKGYKHFKLSHFIPRWRNIINIVCYGAVLVIQTVFCFIGTFVLSYQTNKYLNEDCLSVLALSIPIVGVMNIFVNVIHATVPVNYAEGKYERVKQFFRGCLLLCVLYGVICFSVYALAGRAYFSSLFDSPQIVEYGVSYWFWYGLGFIFVAVIYVIRIFLESIGWNKVALFSGVFEMIGMLMCAFWLIPSFGPIGRFLGNTVGWLLAATYLLSVYFILRKKIYERK